MKICVVGCGTMGAGIVQAFAQSGHTVIMRDVSEEFVMRGRGLVEKQLTRQVTKGRMEEAQKAEIMGRIITDQSLEVLKDVDLVLEAIFENMAAKKKLFAELDDVVKEEAIFASNTSSLSITEIAKDLKHKANFVGMHFFNPAPVMKLIEVIRGADTADSTVEKTIALSEQIGKEPVLCQESPGFVVNRLLIPLINEAANLAELGVASREDIDKAMKLGANHPMGPLALGDLIGLDVCLNIMDTLFAETGDMKFRPSLLLKKMVRAGKLGRKTGEGFFVY